MKPSLSHKFSVFSFGATLLLVLYHARWNYLASSSYIQPLTSYFSNFFEAISALGMAYFFMTPATFCIEAPTGSQLLKS